MGVPLQRRIVQKIWLAKIGRQIKGQNKQTWPFYEKILSSWIVEAETLTADTIDDSSVYQNLIG
jgi:hypothetical protein